MRIKRFKGEEELKIDSKGRVSIPANFRRVLESQDPDWTEGKSVSMTIVYGSHLTDHIECYSVESMGEIQDLIDRMPSAGTRAKAMTRMFLTESLDFSIDDTGRIVLPAKLRSKIGVAMGDAVMFAGFGKTFQIWNPAAYARVVADQEAALAQEDDTFDPAAIFDELRGHAAAATGGA
ncbi:division/cell wall cluster transcriptional repressor MraZ [Pseudooceanicola sediminis]|uniref:division/cell wall cluster transcriptional repressor MraZ n=1 Tax=Pseudooceanicola sediminis TaxID=2211117 RepID=UPI0013146813|nr:cell division/cell wall cluster transcriptional repressor MraZ [Pseudooceanicola sediminis]